MFSVKVFTCKVFFLKKRKSVMKAVILAAGKGERISKGKGKLNAESKPKPLIPLLGLSLIERAILSAKESGICDFIIVVGHRSDEVVRYVEAKQKRLGVNIDFVENEEWEKGNGLSVLKAKEMLKGEDFVLLMCDHVFDSSILKELLGYAKNRKDKCILCVDKPENVFDLEDGTKILLGRDKPKAIGKGLKNYNAVDCGIFYCTSAIFNALEEEAEEGKYELSDAVQCLIDRDILEVFDIDGRFWCDIDTPDSLEYAKNKMLKSLGKPTDGVISKYINRKISTKIFTPLILKMYKEVTPNQVSLLSFAVAALSAFLFFLYHPVIGAIFIQLSSILDGCDGEIARLKKMGSGLGGFIDAILDRYADALILSGMFFYSLVMLSNDELFGFCHGPLTVIFISIMAIIGSLMVSYTAARARADLNYRYGGNRDLRLFLLFIGGLLSYFHPVSVFFSLSIVALMTNIIVMWRSALAWKKFYG